jgi:hypothetical protein
MMKLFESTQQTLSELSGIVENLTAQEYVQPVYYLSNSSIGQHVRHTVELFQCLFNGYDSGEVNYDKRKRDLAIETDNQVAAHLLQQIIAQLTKPDKPITLLANYSSAENDEQVIPTNYFRELAYNLEHTIHHMALIKVGLMEVSSVKPSAEFGVASSTLRYRNECAQ